MAITDKKVSEVYTDRDISSLSDKPNNDGLTATQLKAKFDQLNKEVIPQYNDLIDELDSTFLTNAPVAWETPTLLNSFTNASGFNTYYRKNKLGNVEIMGKLNGGVLSTVIFTLPVDYRPVQRYNFVINANGGNGWGYVDTTGDIVLTGGQLTNICLYLTIFI